MKIMKNVGSFLGWLFQSTDLRAHEPLKSYIHPTGGVITLGSLEIKRKIEN